MLTPRLRVVIESDVPRGKGKAPDDPYRNVRQYFGLGGELLAERDPFAADAPAQVDETGDGEDRHDIFHTIFEIPRAKEGEHVS